MNILMTSKIFVESGVASHIKILAKELTIRGHKVYIASSNNMHETFCKENGIEFVQVNFSLSPRSFLSNIRKLHKFTCDKRIDIVHCHHRTCGVFMHILNTLTGIPFVWSNHLDEIPCDFLHRITTFYGSKTICVSSALKTFCNKQLNIPESDIEVVIHGIAPDEYSYDAQYVENFKAKNNINSEKIIGLFSFLFCNELHYFANLVLVPENNLDSGVLKDVYAFHQMHDGFTRQIRDVFVLAELGNPFLLTCYTFSKFSEFLPQMLHGNFSIFYTLGNFGS